MKVKKSCCVLALVLLIGVISGISAFAAETSQPVTAQTTPGVVYKTHMKKTTANKTGVIALGQGLGCIENDAAIVYDNNNAYTLVVLSNNLNGGNRAASGRIKNIATIVAKRWP